MSVQNSALFYTILVCFFVARLVARELRQRRVHVGNILLLPVVLALVTLGLGFASASIEARLWPAICAGIMSASVLGIAAGLVIDRFSEVTMTDDRRHVLVRGSYVTAAIWTIALGLRFSARIFIGTADYAVSLAATTIALALITAALSTARFRQRERARALRALPRVSGRPLDIA